MLLQGLKERERILGMDHWRTQFAGMVVEVISGFPGNIEACCFDEQANQALELPSCPGFPPPAAPVLGAFEQQTTEPPVITKDQPRPPTPVFEGELTAAPAKTRSHPLRRLVCIAKRISMKMPVGTLYFIADILSVFGLAKDAITILESCLKRVENENKEKQHRFRFEVLDLLGRLYYEVDRIADAEKVLRLSLEGKKALGGGVDGSSVLNTLAWLMETLSCQGEYAKVVELSSETVSTLTNATARPQVLTIAVMHAEALVKVKRYDDAEPLLRDIITHRKADRDTLEEAYKTTTTIKTSGAHERAASLFGLIASARARVLGPRHNDTLMALIDQARTLYGIRRIDECRAACHQLHLSQGTKHGRLRPDAKVWIHVIFRKNPVGRELCGFEWCGEKLGIGAGTSWKIWSSPEDPTSMAGKNGDAPHVPLGVGGSSGVMHAEPAESSPAQTSSEPAVEPVIKTAMEPVVNGSPSATLVASHRETFAKAAAEGAMPICGRNNPKGFFHVAGEYI